MVLEVEAGEWERGQEQGEGTKKNGGDRREEEEEEEEKGIRCLGKMDKLVTR